MSINDNRGSAEQWWQGSHGIFFYMFDFILTNDYLQSRLWNDHLQLHHHRQPWKWPLPYLVCFFPFYLLILLLTMLLLLRWQQQQQWLMQWTMWDEHWWPRKCQTCLGPFICFFFFFPFYFLILLHYVCYCYLAATQQWLGQYIPVERVTLYVVDNTRILGNAIVVKHSL